MSRLEKYRQTLRALDDWIPFLLKNSGLPGPRGNLELAYAVAEEGSKKQFEKFLSLQAEENTPEVFIVFCRVLGLGRLTAGEPGRFDQLRRYASDPRWRIREAVATGLQLVGDQDMDLLLKEMQKWIQGNWYEKRAAAAAVAEPRLLQEPKHVKHVLQLLETVTASMESAANTKDEGFRIVQQAMGYCWSVAVAALPAAGKPMMGKWLNSRSKEVRWIMKANLKKNRLLRMDAAWVKASLAKLEADAQMSREKQVNRAPAK